MQEKFKEFDYHVHFPQGAIPKDGPSAGAAIFTAILSCILDKKVRCDVAMTGETCLRGLVLPIGGVKEKTMAARRSGIKELVFPKGNQKDYEELADEIKEGLKVHFVESYEEIYDVAFKN